MSNPIKCDCCEKSATVHLTQIINNQVKKIDLCEECAKSKGLSSPQGISLSDMFSGAIESNDGTVQRLACPSCGFTHSDFRSHGRFGCPHCYISFRPILNETLESMHPGTCHVGKVPNQLLERMDCKQREALLQQSLKDAISEENYEEAARIRDELAELKTNPELVSAVDHQNDH